MTDHLAGVVAERVETARLATRVLVAGSPDGVPVLFLHGNGSSATYWEETLLAVGERYRAVAVDQRGYGLSARSARIDATAGFGVWADDVLALADHFGWDRFHLVGHSLGGCVAWSCLAEQSQRLISVSLVAPGPPSGFGGSRGPWAQLNHEDGAGSGAGLVHAEFARLLQQGERGVPHPLFSPRSVMNRIYWKPPFVPEREEQLLSAMLQVHCGDQQFPGDVASSPYWPGFAPGKRGPINAISPLYNQRWFDLIMQVANKPPLLWIYGSDDAIVTDQSLSDPGAQGKLGFRDGWPGEDVFPPQPLLTQVTHALDCYEESGGYVRRLVLANVGHTPYLEEPDATRQALMDFLDAA